MFAVESYLTEDQIRLFDVLSDKEKDLLGPITAVVAIRAGFRCEYCGEDMIGSLNAFFTWVLDHIIPKSRFAVGDPDDPENLALSCHTCNSLKSTYDPREGAEGMNGRTFLSQARKHVEEKRQKNQVWLDRVRRAAIFGDQDPK